MLTEICPAEITAEQTSKIKEATQRAFLALNLSVYARMDFLMSSDGEFYLLEANTLPGLTPTSHVPYIAGVAGYSYAELCEKIINLSLEKWKN